MYKHSVIKQNKGQMALLNRGTCSQYNVLKYHEHLLYIDRSRFRYPFIERRFVFTSALRVRSLKTCLHHLLASFRSRLLEVNCARTKT